MGLFTVSNDLVIGLGVSSHVIPNSRFFMSRGVLFNKNGELICINKYKSLFVHSLENPS